MDVARLWRHWLAGFTPARRRFTPAVLARIEAAVQAAELTHEGEIRVAIENALTPAQLWHDLAPRARALQVFASLGVWDTEHNNGVLVYVLLADRSVEFVADRGIARRIGEADWAALVREVEARFGAGEAAEGCILAVQGVARQLGRHFPSAGGDGDELPNQPVLL